MNSIELTCECGIKYKFSEDKEGTLRVSKIIEKILATNPKSIPISNKPSLKLLEELYPTQKKKNYPKHIRKKGTLNSYKFWHKQAKQYYKLPEPRPSVSNYLKLNHIAGDYIPKMKRAMKYVTNKEFKKLSNHIVPEVEPKQLISQARNAELIGKPS